MIVQVRVTSGEDSTDGHCPTSYTDEDAIVAMSRSERSESYQVPRHDDERAITLPPLQPPK